MRRLWLVWACAWCLLMNGCGVSPDYFRLANSGLNLAKAGTVNEEDVKNMTLQVRQHMDRAADVAPEGSKYVQRLNRVMANETSVNGVPLNYKVYMSPDLNASASPDGSIRVNSGLMDAMNDDELRFVLGHELGHIAHGHAVKAMRMAYTTAAGRAAAGAFNPYAALAADSALGDMAKDFVNAKYSQSQELDADIYGMNYLKSHHYNTGAAISAMRKLGKSGGGFFSTHPSNAKRLENLAALEKGVDPKTLNAGD